MRYLAVLLVSVFAAVGLAATTLLATSPAAEAAGGGDVKRCGGGMIFLNADEKQTFALHNRERRDRNITALCVHPDLQKAAWSHSKDMIQRDYFSHDTKGRNESSCQRIRRFGYHWHACGENIGYDSTPNKMFNAWMRSSGHRRNILNGKFREVGIGAYTGNYKGFETTMYTADFGARR
jgi:uncharacterized protein YkwD